MKYKSGNVLERASFLESKNLIKKDGAVKQKGTENLEIHYLCEKAHQTSKIVSCFF